MLQAIIQRNVGLARALVLVYNGPVEKDPQHSIEVGSTWDGHQLPQSERALVSLETQAQRWVLRFVAPFDPRTRSPSTKPGATEGLWEYEVTELFVAGALGHYLEVEVGPGGHFAVFYFEHVRQRKRNVAVLHNHFTSQLLTPELGRFEAEIHLAQSDVPGGVRSWNAYRITGNPGARRYHAAHPVVGAAPDFHRLECFAPCPV